MAGKRLKLATSAVTTTVIAACFLGGCQPGAPTTQPSAASAATPAAAVVTPQPTAEQPIVAKINGQSITTDQLTRPLIDTYGLAYLLNIAQLELAKREADVAKVTVTPDDIARERQTTLTTMFREAPKEDYERLLSQLLTQKGISRSEFDLKMATNAYLRKIAEPKLKITDENLQEAFRALYGETVEVRDIQLNNLQEVATVRKRLDAGDTFEQIAREMSRDPRTQPAGGRLPAFSRQMTSLSEAFKEAAFGLKEPGDISDPVQTGDSYHLLQLIKKNSPKAVKFEDVKEAVRKELADRWIQNQIRLMHIELLTLTRQALDVRDPVMRKQYDDMLAKQDAEARQMTQSRLATEQQRRDLSQQQTLPTTAPANGPATPEAPQRPPATKSGQ